ncbi:MAG TPA: FRG domain-containing protein [Solirubrobacterales bacterium]|nr:FRG domain-containing protein [Solirubrobacterales bacterium]
MLELFGSDAEQFAPPRYFDEQVQVPAISLFAACGERFAQQAYRDGVRWVPAFGAEEDPSDALRLALGQFATRRTDWLHDTWTGREVYPHWPGHTTIHEMAKWHASLEPRANGSPGLPAILPPSMVGSLHHARDVRSVLAPVAPQRRSRLDGEIGVWQVASLPALKTAIVQIQGVVAEHKGAKPKLWFRGQARQFKRTRDPDIARWLGIETDDLSLVPSIARPGADAMPTDPQEARRWAWGYDFIWRAPFISWLAEQPGYAPRDPEVRAQLDQLTDDVVPERIGSALYLIEHHPELDALDDLRQWWIMGAGRSRVLPLLLQHYGSRTTVLDLTSSIHVALYFARRTWDEGQQAFRDSDVGARCIYIFSESPQDEFIIDSTVLVGGLPQPVVPPQRVLAQSCGLVTGASAQATNRAADLVVGVIELDDDTFDGVPDDYAMYPPPHEDSLFSRLLHTRPAPPGLMRFGC